MRTTAGRILLSLLCLGLVLLAACGGKKQPVRVNMVLNAASNVNADARGQALSVVVRIYQLKDKGRLELADYNAVWKNEKETLADDLVRRQERVVQPGTQETIEVTADPQAAYLGVVALFRNPSGDSWRRIVPLSGKTQNIKLTLSEQNIEISSSEK